MAESLTDKLKLSKRDTGDINWGQGANANLDAVVAGAFLLLVGAIVLVSVVRWIGLCSGKKPMDLRETPEVLLPESAMEPVSRGGAWAAGLLAFGLMRHLSGETEFERAQSRPCCEAHSVEKDPGKSWAKLQEKRFDSPRCC